MEMIKVDLINLYIQEVTRRLPEKIREDISLELRSTILDTLPNDFTENDVKQSLEKLGNPAVLASRYRERPMHLIGPKFYDMYITILKMVMPIVAIVIFIIFFTEKFGSIFGSETSPLVIAPVIVGEAIWLLLNTIIQVFFWVTIVFIILERTIGSADDIPLSLSGAKWTPKDLENLPYIPLKREITKGEVVFTLFWTVLWATLYFNATNIIGVYQRNNSGLAFTLPIFNQEILMSYLAIVIIIIVLEIFRVAYMAIARQWTFNLAVSNALINLASFILLIMIASNPNIFNSEFAPYIANIIDKPLETVITAIFWLKWFIVSIVIVTSLIDTYNGFRKARIK